MKEQIKKEILALLELLEDANKLMDKSMNISDSFKVNQAILHLIDTIKKEILTLSTTPKKVLREVKS